MRTRRRKSRSIATRSRVWLALTPIILAWVAMGAQPAVAGETHAGAIASYFTTGTAGWPSSKQVNFSVNSGSAGCDGHGTVRVTPSSSPPSKAWAGQCYLALSGSIKRVPGLIYNFREEMTASGLLEAYSYLSPYGGIRIEFSFTSTLEPCGGDAVYCGRISGKGTELYTGLPVTVEGTIAMPSLFSVTSHPVITGSLSYHGSR